MPRKNQIAVIFCSQRNGDDEDGYQSAAIEMERLARLQPGYCGMESAKNTDGLGITISYWASEEAAAAWRDNPEHARVRDLGRAHWYSWYKLDVTRIERSYDWQRDG